MHFVESLSLACLSALHVHLMLAAVSVLLCDAIQRAFCDFAFYQFACLSVCTYGKGIVSVCVCHCAQCVRAELSVLDPIVSLCCV